MMVCLKVRQGQGCWQGVLGRGVEGDFSFDQVERYQRGRGRGVEGEFFFLSTGSKDTRRAGVLARVLGRVLAGVLFYQQSSGVCVFVRENI